MIFSEELWVKGREQDAHIPVSASLSFCKMAPSLENTQEMFLNPLLGDELTSEMETAYRQGDIPAPMAELIKMAQKSVMNLTFWYYFDSLQMRITDQGFQRQGSEEWQQPYKYQEDRLRENFKIRGFNGLDQLLEYLYGNLADFPSFASSKAYTDIQKAIVRTMEDVNSCVYIGNSYLVFLRLRIEFASIEESRLVTVMGRDLYDKFRAWLIAPDTFPTDEATCTLEELRVKCATVVVRNAVVRLLKQTGTITDQGLYFNITAASGDNNRSLQPATDVAIGDRLVLYESDARMAEDNLSRFLSKRMPNLYEGRGLNHVVRDNDGRQAFFAM